LKKRRRKKAVVDILKKIIMTTSELDVYLKSAEFSIDDSGGCVDGLVLSKVPQQNCICVTNFLRSGVGQIHCRDCKTAGQG